MYATMWTMDSRKLLYGIGLAAVLQPRGVGWTWMGGRLKREGIYVICS